MREWEEKQFIFVCGLHRSGTSLLFQLLREHPDISGFENTDSPEDEGQHLQSVYPTAKVFGGPGKFALNAESFMDETSPLARAEHAERLYGEWSPLWDTSARYLLEKSPPSLVRTRYFQKLFPKSKFVIFERHPIAVSLATKKWSRNSVRELILHWLKAHERFERDRPHLNHVYVMHYERLILDPNGEMERLYRFLDLEPILNDVEVNPTINQKYFDQWNGLCESLKFRIKNGLFMRWAERRVRRFGYSLRDFEQLPPAE